MSTTTYPRALCDLLRVETSGVSRVVVDWSKRWTVTVTRDGVEESFPLPYLVPEDEA